MREPRSVDFGLVKDSIRDMTRIYKVPVSKASSFVSWYERKYKIPRGHHNELEVIVRDEIEKMKTEGTK